MNFLSKIKIIGTLTIHVRDGKTGHVLRTIVKENTITYNAGDVVRALLAQRATDNAAAELALGSMRFGTSTTTPTRNDTNLGSEVAGTREQLQDVNKVDGISGEISLQATLDTTEANGNTLTEAGLFTTGTAWANDVGGTTYMFARQIHSPIAKTSSISLDYNWKLQFTT